MLDFVHFPFAKNHLAQRRKVALDRRNDDQRPIDKLFSGHWEKNSAKSICALTSYSEKGPKHVALFLVGTFFYDIRKKYAVF